MIHVWDPRSRRAVASNDDAVRGEPASRAIVPFEITEKPSLAFHVLRRPDGTPIDTAKLRSQIWIGYVWGPTLDRHAHVRISTPVDRDTPPTGAGWRLAYSGSHGAAWDKVTPGSGIVLYEELALGALKGMANWKEGYWFFPFADGSFQARLRSGNDFQVMESNLCRKLRSGLPYCPGPELSVFGY